MASNPLSAQSLSKYIAQSLPTNAATQLQSPTDAIAIACHAGMLAVRFRLEGLGEDHRIEAYSDPSSPQPLPTEWNAASSNHSFRYAHVQSSMQYLLKVSKLGAKTVVYGIGMGDDKTTSFDLTTKDFISEPALPATPLKGPDHSSEDAMHEIQSIFISPSRLSELGSLLRLNIIQKLVPGLQKEGYEETSASVASRSRNNQDEPQHPRDPSHDPARYDPLRDGPMQPGPTQPHPLADPSFAPRRPVPDFAPPGFEDEYEINSPPGGRPLHPGGPFADYGSSDLNPAGLGGHDPLRIGGGGGGMHPSFGGVGGGNRGPFGPQRPPGARFDPRGPQDLDDPMGDFGMGPRGGGRGGGFGPGGGMGGGFGGGHNPFGGLGGGDII